MCSNNLVLLRGNEAVINNLQIYANTNWKFHSSICNAVVKSSFQILERIEISIINTYVVFGVEVGFFSWLMTQNICCVFWGWEDLVKTVFSLDSVILSKTHSSIPTYFSTPSRCHSSQIQSENYPHQPRQLFNSSIILWTKWWILLEPKINRVV